MLPDVSMHTPTSLLLLIAVELIHSAEHCQCQLCPSLQPAEMDTRIQRDPSSGAGLGVGVGVGGTMGAGVGFGRAISAGGTTGEPSKFFTQNQVRTELERCCQLKSRYTPSKIVEQSLIDVS